MPLMSRKGLLAIAAVIDVAINARAPRCRRRPWQPVIRPPRDLEPVLQALVRDASLKVSVGRMAVTNSAGSAAASRAMTSSAPPLRPRTPMMRCRRVLPSSMT